MNGFFRCGHLTHVNGVTVSFSKYDLIQLVTQFTYKNSDSMKLICNGT